MTINSNVAGVSFDAKYWERVESLKAKKNAAIDAAKDPAKKAIKKGAEVIVEKVADLGAATAKAFVEQKAPIATNLAGKAIDAMREGSLGVAKEKIPATVDVSVEGSAKVSKKGTDLSIDGSARSVNVSANLFKKKSKN